MALTVLMFVVLIASYALMFGLVKFTENVIAETRYGATANGAAATTEDTANSLSATPRQAGHGASKPDGDH